jgi:hypothetical protein
MHDVNDKFEIELIEATSSFVNVNLFERNSFKHIYIYSNFEHFYKLGLDIEINKKINKIAKRDENTDE